jgi:hypothetical protein
VLELVVGTVAPSLSSSVRRTDTEVQSLHRHGAWVDRYRGTVPTAIAGGEGQSRPERLSGPNAVLQFLFNGRRKWLPHSRNVQLTIHIVGRFINDFDFSS